MFDQTRYTVIIFFFLSHIYGITAGYVLQDSVLAGGTQVVNADPSSGITLFLMIGAATAVMIGLYKFRMNRVIKAWYFTALFMTSLIFFSSFFPPGLAFGITVAVFIVRYFNKDYWIRNFLDTFSYAGAGALFGTMLGIAPALIFIGILSLYDIIAVFFTKHMISLVKGGLATDTFMGIVYPKDSDTAIGTESDTTHNSSETMTFGVVGGGDIIVPMFLSVSLLSSNGIIAAFSASIGASIGLGLLLYKGEQNTFYPAIPIIGGGAVLGWLLSSLLI